MLGASLWVLSRRWALVSLASIINDGFLSLTSGLVPCVLGAIVTKMSFFVTHCKGSVALSCEIGHSHSFRSSQSHRTAKCHCYPSRTSLPSHRLVICLHHLVSPHVSFFIPPSIPQIRHSLPCHIPVPSAIVRCPLLLKPFRFRSDNVPRSFSCLQLRR